MSRRKRGKRGRGALGSVLVGLVACVVLLTACLMLRHWVVGTVRIAGNSMNDTLVSGDVVLIERFAYRGASPERGDVVECRFPGRADTYVKRVIGLPGDEVVFADNQLTVNGQPVREPYVSSATEDYAILLPEDAYLVLGDNRAVSYDSRMEDMGPIGADDFLGRARWILWPPARIGRID